MIDCARPSESAWAIAAKNAGVASGKGLPASAPMASRVRPCLDYDEEAARVKKAVVGGLTSYFSRGPDGVLLTAWTNTGWQVARTGVDGERSLRDSRLAQKYC